MEESPCGIAAIVVRSLIPAADGPVRTEEGVRPSGETARAWVGSVQKEWTALDHGGRPDAASSAIDRPLLLHTG